MTSFCGLEPSRVIPIGLKLPTQPDNDSCAFYICFFAQIVAKNLDLVDVQSLLDQMMGLGKDIVQNKIKFLQNLQNQK